MDLYGKTGMLNFYVSKFISITSWSRKKEFSEIWYAFNDRAIFLLFFIKYTDYHIKIFIYIIYIIAEKINSTFRMT